MEGKKRERSANFNNVEVQLLVSLVEKYKHIIENKKTDAVTNRDKECAWKKIEISFNSCGISTIERSWKTLKLKYEGIKKSTKMKSSVQRQEMYRTGGGPSNAPDFTNVEEKVLSICSNIKGLDARYDSDTISSDPLPITISDVTFDLGDDEIKLMETQEQNGAVAEGTTQDNIIEPDMDISFVFEANKENCELQKENQWDKWNPKALKTKVTNILRTEKVNKASVTTKLDELSSARLELVKLQMDLARKELEFKEEEYRLKLEHLANDEKRKQEVHVLLLKKWSCNVDVNDVPIYNNKCLKCLNKNTI